MNLQEKNESIQHDMKDKVKELKECVEKLEEELAPTKSISELLSDWLLNMERQCWLTFSTLEVSAWKRPEYLKVLQQVTWKKLFLKFWRKLGWKFRQRTFMHDIELANKDASLRRKDCQQVLSVKKDVQKISTTDADLPNATIKLYLNESLCPYYRVSHGQKVKHYLQRVKFIVISFQLDQLK